MADIHFTTSAERLAYVFRERHIGRSVFDLQTGDEYVITTEGSGSGVMEVLNGGGGGGSNASDITNDSGVTGATVADALDTLDAAITALEADVAASANVWDARVVPSGLHASSDEFLTDTTANYTEWDEGAYVTWSYDSSRRAMKATGTGNGSFRVSGFYKAVPSNTFTALCEIAWDGPYPTGTTGMGAGLCVVQNGGVAGTDFISGDSLLRNGGGSFSAHVCRTSTAYNSTGTSSVNLSLDDIRTSLWVRIRVTMTTGPNLSSMLYDISTDGIHWLTVSQTPQTGSYVAAHVGLLYYNHPADANTVYFRHFRVFNGVAGFSDTLNGGYLIA